MPPVLPEPNAVTVFTDACWRLWDGLLLLFLRWFHTVFPVPTAS